MKYSQTDAMSAIVKYSGKNEGTLSDIEVLFMVDDAARLASRLPNCGPVVALEIVGAVARMLAKDLSQ